MSRPSNYLFPSSRIAGRDKDKKNRLVCGKPGGMYSPYCFNRTMQSGAKEDS